MRNQNTPVKLTKGEKIALIRRVKVKLAFPPLSLGRCDACNKQLEEAEQRIRGYASGCELGFCRRCAAEVNTEQAIAYAEHLGVKPKARAIVYAPAAPTGFVEID